MVKSKVQLLIKIEWTSRDLFDKQQQKYLILHYSKC